jgi:hypothetical protein
VSLLPNSVDTWDQLEQRFQDYFYNGESELRLSHLVAVRQKHNETVFEYMRQFRDTHNKCYGLTIGEKDISELAFAGLSMVLKIRWRGKTFQTSIRCCSELCPMRIAPKILNHTTDSRRLVLRTSLSVNWVEEDADSEGDTEVCVADWVDTPRDKSLAISFLRPSPRKKEEVKFTFHVSKCNKLFDVLLQNKVICLSEGHVVPPPGQVAKGKYCKWHGTFSHTTNECNYSG